MESYSGYDVRAGNSRKPNSADLGSDKQGITSIDDLADYEGLVDLPTLYIPEHFKTVKIPIFDSFCKVGELGDSYPQQMQAPSYNVLELHRDGDSWIVD